jgi:hypothetical protein
MATFGPYLLSDFLTLRKVYLAATPSSETSIIVKFYVLILAFTPVLLVRKKNGDKMVFSQFEFKWVIWMSAIIYFGLSKFPIAANRFRELFFAFELIFLSSVLVNSKFKFVRRPACYLVPLLMFWFFVAIKNVIYTD